MPTADRAALQLELAAKLDPTNGATQENLSQALMLTKDTRSAAKAFAAASAINPNNVDLKYNPALALLDSGSPKQAGALLDALPPASITPEIPSLAGDADEHTGECRKALAHYEAAAKANPSDANIYAVVADYGAARYPGSEHFPIACIAPYARSDCRAAVADFAEHHPGNAVMTTYAAVVILHAPQREQNLDIAASLLATPITDDPKYAEAYLRMGVLEQMRQHWAASAPYLEKSVGLSPTAPEPHYRLSRAYAHMGRSEDAQAQIALHKTYSQKAKDSIDARLQEVMQFILNPS